jgi:diacylglycerol kinase (ATP)
VENTQVPAPAAGITRIIKAGGYSLKGLAFAWRAEAAFRQEVVLCAGLLVCAMLVSVSAVERALLILTLGLVLVVELVNTAVEACIDRIGPDYHALSGAAKDVGSAAVLVAFVVGALVWATILL